MENVYMTQPDLQALKEKVLSTTTIKSGSRGEDAMQAGIAWAKEVKKKGWFETPDGILPMIEIQKAGFRWNDKLDSFWDRDTKKFITKPRGYDTIPSQEYITDGVHSDTAGVKVVSASEQYLRWREDYNKRMSMPTDSATEMLKDLTKQPELAIDATEEGTLSERYGVLDKDGNIDPEKIPF